MANQIRPYYVTTSIPYVNGAPHVGFALELVIADVLARHRRQRGDDVRFQAGTDENSLKNVRAADREGIPTRALVERNAARFYALRDLLGLSFDDFIRTSSDPRHAPGVARLWRACARRGDVYRRTYRGLYCVGCEQFYNEAELSRGRCPEHDTPPESIDEENYFFRLSRYQEPLRALLESGRLRVDTEPYRNELLAFVRAGLDDISISRSSERARGWGVPVPGDARQVTYVWFDALGNYLTALDYAKQGAAWRRYWAGHGQRVHVIGKGVTRFHGIYWPAFLLSAGLPLPDRILVHGYLTLDGAKISKSGAGAAAATPEALVARFGTDALRYHLLRHTRAQQDGDFRVSRLAEVYRAELAGQLGNLASRVFGLVRRSCGGAVPSTRVEPASLTVTAEALPARIDAALEGFRIHAALDAVWELVAAGNRFVEDAAPWKRTGAARDEVLYAACELLRLIAVHLGPYLPGTASRLLEALGANAPGCPAWGGLAPGTRLRQRPVLFPRLE